MHRKFDNPRVVNIRTEHDAVEKARKIKKKTGKSLGIQFNEMIQRAWAETQT